MSLSRTYSYIPTLEKVENHWDRESFLVRYRNGGVITERFVSYESLEDNGYSTTFQGAWAFVRHNPK